MSRLPGLTVLVPAYNEESSLEAVVKDVLAVGPEVAEETEILIIDDGSTDGTPEIAERLAMENPGIRAIHHPRNLGFGATQQTGFGQARMPFISLVPSDGQFPVRDLARFLPYANESDIVLGFRLKREDGPWRRIQAGVFKWVFRTFLGLPFKDINWVKLYRREAVASIRINSRRIGADAEVLVKVLRKGGRIKETEVSYLPRHSGVASSTRPLIILKTLMELSRIWLDLVTGKIS